jgi:hercynylcysteine S-oxide lyase
VAALLRAPVDTCVFVSNATVGVNTVLRNLAWAADGRDEILYFDTIYSGCAKSVDFIVDSYPDRVAARCIPLPYPLEDEEVLARFEAGVAASQAAGRRPRLALFDVVSSLPGVVFPTELIVQSCRRHEMLSLVDGAQGIGMVDIDLGRLDPDFFVSNCHKWLHVPRGCAVFYTPMRNQHLLPSTLATSHGYVPKSGSRFNPLPPSSKTTFVNNFEFVGTIDNAPYLCVADSIRWREEVLGGEKRVLEYTQGLAKAGGLRVAEILGTHVLENQSGTLGRCTMVNVALPLWVGTGPEGKVLSTSEAPGVKQWMEETLIADHNTFIQLFIYQQRFWTRLSAQVYLDMSDFEFGGRVLESMCARAAKKALGMPKL